MKYMILALALMGGCASPAADYVSAEAAAWQQIDDKLDGWIESEPSYDAPKKDALHQLNVGRRARVSHALAQPK